MTSADSSRALLERMLARVREMRLALRDAATAAPPTGEIDFDRALAAIDDLERRVRQVLERETPAAERAAPPLQEGARE
ncbi:MAG: hypothetical protein QN141_03510 [Armatimonadota bacterium]|nr:hypothetical protein [Armatimonadota bacterium]MDR7451411.1 hypothetical protein [Armatimonadota bacterium]MDR7466439.1 hypothetical protein [Armatimonadota bacterium]MDR7493161.1 hypothetical protein [Armatimonadota bacterium]MDR7500350.1 hypothetical protein [Armatimonadota bacterium]